MPFQIAPSILSADFLRLGEEISLLNSHAQLIHIDVMDGSFVPNISMGIVVTEAVSRIATIPLDVHLMVVNPQKWTDRFISAGAGRVSFHLEAARDAGVDPALLLGQIRSQGALAGLAFNPDVPVREAFPYLESADFILVMSVFAGFSGQKFIPESLERIAELKAEIDRRGLPCSIEVDGGVGPGNIASLRRAGVDTFVAANAIYSHTDRAAAIADLRAAAGV